MTKPNFKNDLEFARGYEKRIADYFGATISSDKRWDIELEGKTIELKIDRYFDSENFFIETVSDIKSQKSGGPYRSLEDKVDEFWYIFVNDNSVCIYKWLTKELINDLKKVSGKTRQVKNRAWITEGKLIKRKDLNCKPINLLLEN